MERVREQGEERKTEKGEGRERGRVEREGMKEKGEMSNISTIKVLESRETFANKTKSNSCLPVSFTFLL